MRLIRKKASEKKNPIGAEVKKAIADKKKRIRLTAMSKVSRVATVR